MAFNFSKSVSKGTIVILCIVAFIVPLISWIGAEEWDVERLKVSDAIGFIAISITSSLLLFTLTYPFTKGDKLDIANKSYKIFLAAFFVMTYLSALYIADYNHHGLLAIGFGEQLWWGQSTTSYYIAVIYEAVVGLLIVGTFSFFFLKRDISKYKHIIAGIVGVVAISGIAATAVYITQSQLCHKAWARTLDRFKDKSALEENIKGTYWTNTKGFSSTPKIPIEIIFSIDDNTAQILYDNADLGVHEYEIGRTEDNGRSYLYLDFGVGKLDIKGYDTSFYQHSIGTSWRKSYYGYNQLIMFEKGKDYLLNEGNPTLIKYEDKYRTRP